MASIVKRLIERRKARRQLDRAIETGKALDKAGVKQNTPRDTSGNYITPGGTVSVDKKGNVNVRTLSSNSGSSSGSSSSGSSGGSRGSSSSNSGSSSRGSSPSSNLSSGDKTKELLKIDSSKTERALRQTPTQNRQSPNIQIQAQQRIQRNYGTVSLDPKIDRNLGRDEPKTNLKERFLKEFAKQGSEIATNVNLEQSPARTIKEQKQFVSTQLKENPFLGASVAAETGGLFFKKGVEGIENITGIDENKKQAEKIKKTQDNLNTYYRTYQETVNVDIPRFESKYDMNKLTESQVKEYNALVNRANEFASKYENTNKQLNEFSKETTKKFNIFGFEKEVSVTKLTSPFGYVKEAITLPLEMVGSGVGKAYGDVSKLTGKVSKTRFETVGQFVKGDITGKEFVSSFKKREPGIVFDLNAGVVREETTQDFKKDQSSSLLFVQPKEVEKVTTGALVGATYLVPYVGNSLFAAEIGQSASDVGYSPRRFVKEKPVEAALIGGIALTAGTVRTGQYLKKPLVKETATGFRVTSRFDEFAGQRIKLSKAPDNAIGIKTEYLPSKRGLVVDYVNIKQPKANVKASETIGYESGNNILFPEQVLEQVSSAGRRTVVKRVTGKGEDILYFGLPSGKKEYKEVSKELSKLFGEDKAKQILRFTAPRIERQTLKGGVLNVNNNKLTGNFVSLQERPSVLVDDILGIKTRGGKSVRETQYIDRTELGGSSKISIGAEKTQSILTFPKNKAVDVKGFEFKAGVSVSKSSGVKEFRKNVGIETIESASASTYTPFDGRLFIDSGKTTLVKPIESVSEMGFKGGGKRSSQEYFQELYSQKQAPVIKQLPKPKPLPTPKKSNLELVEKVEVKSLGFNPLPSIKENSKEDFNIIRGEEMSKSVSQGLSRGLIGEIGKESSLDLSQSKITESQRDLIKSKVNFGTGNKSRDSFKFNQPVKEQFKFNEKVEQKQPQQEKQQQKEVQSQRERQEFKTAQSVKQILETFSRQRPKTKTKTFTPKIIIKPKGDTKVKTPTGNGLFKVFVRKKGEDVLEKKAKTKEEAENILFGTLGKELRASGVVTFKGQKVKLGLREGFRRSKLDAFRVVEQKERRIKRKSKSKEARDIQSFRRKRNGLF